MDTSTDFNHDRFLVILSFVVETLFRSSLELVYFILSLSYQLENANVKYIPPSLPPLEHRMSQLIGRCEAAKLTSATT